MGALRADAVAENGLRILGNICLDLVPVTLVVTDLLATGADWQKTAEEFYLLRCLLKFKDQLPTLTLTHKGE